MSSRWEIRFAMMASLFLGLALSSRFAKSEMVLIDIDPGFVSTAPLIRMSVRYLTFTSELSNKCDSSKLCRRVRIVSASSSKVDK